MSGNSLQVLEIQLNHLQVRKFLTEKKIVADCLRRIPVESNGSLNFADSQGILPERHSLGQHCVLQKKESNNDINQTTRSNASGIHNSRS